MSHSSFHTCNVYLAIHLHMSLHDNTHDIHTKINVLFFFLLFKLKAKELQRRIFNYREGILTLLGDYIQKICSEIIQNITLKKQNIDFLRYG